MKYVSTRGGVEPVDFSDAVMMGLADDGGLLIPERLPDLSGRLGEWRELDYRALAEALVAEFVTDIDRSTLRALIDRSYGEQFPPDVAPVAAVGGLYVLELFGGPTLAFKDMALQLLGNLFEHILTARGERMNILGATSGDTGSAAIAGARGRDGIDIFVMHPHGRVSPIQQRQMTAVLDANVHNIAIEGSFDDCQRILKQLFADLPFKRQYKLGAVNSVNWARVLAQVVYYFHACFRVQEITGARQVRFAVPTGNFGDILAGYYARKMGLPISRLVLATNENDILARFFNRGDYSLAEVHKTLSPSMDIQVASNFERYLYDRLGCDPQRLSAVMQQFAETGAIRLPAGPEGVDPLFAAGSADRAATLDAIGRYYREYGYVLDPHTAVGVHVAEQVGLAGDPMICLATAHPAKFPDAVREATGDDQAARHGSIDALAELPTRCTTLANDPEAVRAFMVETLR